MREGIELLHRHFSACVAGLVGGDPQQQIFPELSATVGQQVVLPCQSTSEDSVNDLYFFWYRQLPGKTLQYVLDAYITSENVKFHNGQFSMVVYKNKTAPLEIATVSFQDAAMYYCAVECHVKPSPISARANSATAKTAQKG